MAKIRNFVVLFFGIAVCVVWVGEMLPIPQLDWGYQGTGLAQIDFSFFSKNIRKNYITQAYGRTSFSLWGYKNAWHNGIDIAAKSRSPIRSATVGIVLAIGNQDNYCYKRAFGKFVVVKNENDNKTLLYGHLSKILVTEGTIVKAGDVIGLVGQTGEATASHLHFSVFSSASFTLPTRDGCGPYPTGKDSNPIPYLDALNHKSMNIATK